MGHLKVKICKVKEPASLVSIEILRLMEICQVFVISENLHWEGGALEVMAPCVETVDDCKEFLVIDVIISFSRGEQLGEIGARVPVPIGVGLQEDPSRSMLLW